MKVRVTWQERQYYSTTIELDKVPETEEEKRAAMKLISESDGYDLGDTYTDGETFEEDVDLPESILGSGVVPKVPDTEEDTDGTT